MTDTDTTIDDALQAIRALRLELAELRAELANEVRTRKLVVVDARGREVLFTEEYEGATQLRLRWPYGAERERLHRGRLVRQ